MPFKGIVVWAFSVNLHSFLVYNEIAKHTPVTLCVMISKFRNLGSLNLDNCRLVEIKSVDDAPRETLNPGYLHITGALKRLGYWAPVYDCVKMAVEAGCQVMGLNMEQYPWWGAKGLLRSMQWLWIYNFGLGRKVKAIGCLGQSGIRAYRRAGVSRRRIFEYVYAPPCVSVSYTPPHAVEGGLKEKYQITFIGQIISRKAIVESVENLRQLDEDFELHIVGEGSQAELLKRSVAGDSRMTYHGKLEINQVHQLLERTDLLLLPSRFDGWGATLNEALMHGCRGVVCNHAGSHSLIEYTGFGQVFADGDWAQFREQVRGEIARGKVPQEERAAIKRWSLSIQPEAVSKYLTGVINYYFGDLKEKPTPPWREKN